MVRTGKLTKDFCKKKNRGWFDWANDQWADRPQPSDKRYRWKGEMGHLISDEFEE